jgi:DNA-binding Xre family transcriptional regulator
MEKYEMKPKRLAEKAGISQNIMTRIRRGQYISLESVEAICRALGCCIADILEFTESCEPDREHDDRIGRKIDFSGQNSLSERDLFQETINSCNIRLEKGDCLERMNDIEDESIDMILCDLPFGTTANEWDKRVPMEPLWDHYIRIIKPTAARPDHSH